MSALDREGIREEFWQARQQGTYFPPQWFGRLSLEDGYGVQLGLLERYLARGSRQIGWKVGLSAPAIQQQFGVHEPVFGFILAADRHPSGAELPFDKLIEPGIENEVCVTLGSDLAGPGVDRPAARAAIAMVQPSFEIIETRGPFTEQLAVAIAENVQQKGVVLGAPTRPVPPDLDLARLGVTVTINGEVVAAVAGDQTPADPVASIVWLANKLATHGHTLKAGDIVMTGSLTRQFAVRRGDRVAASFDVIGAVEVAFV